MNFNNALKVLLPLREKKNSFYIVNMGLILISVGEQHFAHYQKDFEKVVSFPVQS